MKRFLLNILPLLAAIFTACTEHGDFERRLATADSLMTHEMPDSAYRMLCEMNAEAESMPQSLRMRHLLLRSNAQNKAYVDFTSDSIGCLLVNYYDAHGTPNERMLAHYIKGCAYRDMGDQPASLRCYNDAVAAADTSRADCNYDQLSIIYGQIARIFNQRAMPDNALQTYEYAERYARKVQDSIGIFTIWGNKSDALINQGKIQEALRIKETAAEGFRKMGYPQYAAQVMGLCIKWYARQGEFDKAKAAMDEYEALSGYFTEDGDAKTGKEGYYSIKGTYFLEKGGIDSAEHYFRKLLNNKSIKNQHLAAWGLSQLFKRQSISDSIAKYAYLGDILGDTLYSEQVAKSLQAAQSQYNYTRHLETAHRKELEAKEAKLKQFKWVIRCIVIAVLASVLCGGIIFFWRKRSRKFRRHFKLIHQYIGQKKTELDISRQENSDLCTQLHTANEENTLLNTQIDANNRKINRLNKQIKDKTRLIQELNKTINQNATDLAQLEQFKQTITILEQQIIDHRQQIHKLCSGQKQNKLQDEPAIVRLRQTIGEKGTPNSAEWKEIIAVVEEYYPGMLALKQQHDIRAAEYRLCILIKLGVEIADILNIEGTYHAHITNMRRRMLAKLGKSGGAKEFDRFIASI